MLEVRVLIEAPELTTAINNLSAAISERRSCTESDAVKITPQSIAAPADSLPAIQNVPQSKPAPSAVAVSAQPSPLPISGPAAQPQKITLDQIFSAGAVLMDAGKASDLVSLLHSFNVQAVTDLKPEQYNAFGEGLRNLGAQI